MTKLPLRQTPGYNPTFEQPSYGAPSLHPPSILSPPTPYPVGQPWPQVTALGKHQNDTGYGGHQADTHQSLQLQQQLELEEQREREQFAKQQLQQRREFQRRTLHRRTQQYVAEGVHQVQTPTQGYGHPLPMMSLMTPSSFSPHVVQGHGAGLANIPGHSGKASAGDRPTGGSPDMGGA